MKHRRAGAYVRPSTWSSRSQWPTGRVCGPAESLGAVEGSWIQLDFEVWQYDESSAEALLDTDLRADLTIGVFLPEFSHEEAAGWASEVPATLHATELRKGKLTSDFELTWDERDTNGERLSVAVGMEPSWDLQDDVE